MLTERDPVDHTFGGGGHKNGTQRAFFLHSLHANFMRASLPIQGVKFSIKFRDSTS